MSGVAIIGCISLDLLFTGIPRLPGQGEEIYSEGFDIQLGCGTFVYATVLNRLGVPVRFGTFLSEGMRSKIARLMLEKEFQNKYINLYHSPLDTASDPIIISASMSTKIDRSFMSYADPLPKKLLTDEEVYQFCKGADVCPVLPDYISVMAKLKKEGTRFVHDAWWRDDMTLKQEIPILELSEVFSPNDKEALKLTGTDNVEDAIRILAKYVKYPIVTLGSRGSLLYVGGKMIYIKPPADFNCVDTTGAGDNFLAGVMYGMYKKWDIVQSVRMGNITGGFSTTQVGCCKAYLDVSTSEKYMKNYNNL